MDQPTLFDHVTNEDEIRNCILFALGDFQSRGKVLAERELPLDRLRGAFKRASDRFGITELSDEVIVATLGGLGAKIRRVPNYVAKHPYKVTVPTAVALIARDAYAAARAKAPVA